MKYKYICMLFLIAIIGGLLGCKTHEVFNAELTIDKNGENIWHLDERLSQTGSNNVIRVVKGASLEADNALELTAENDGEINYSMTEEYFTAGKLDVRLRFLSTQGSGRIKLEYLNSENEVIAAIGWVVTGKLPANSAQQIWYDVRANNNYTGNWIWFTDDIGDLFHNNFLAVDEKQIAKVRFTVAVGQGQHCFITNFNLHTNYNKAVKLQVENSSFTMKRGETADITLKASNMTNSTLENIVVNVIEPYGYGLTLNSPTLIRIEQLLPGEEKSYDVQIVAHRPSEVNFNRPWQLGFSIDNLEPQTYANINVQDERPGKIFYVMTEDLEPIDGAGYVKKWGNANGWLDAEEIILQMADKAEKINAIAEKYNARWTHYIAWPAIRACDWLNSRHANSKLGMAAEIVRKSVEKQAKNGHEYALHLHSDYDPHLPGNFLSYNEQVDGFWANHLNHGWAHSILEEGTPENYATRTGIIYSYKSELDYLTRKSGQGQVITARAGSFDFGSGSEDEAKSIRAYQKSGIYGSSDADGNAGGLTSSAYGQEIYLTSHNDINKPAVSLKDIGIVEFRPTPLQPIMYDGASEIEWNDKVVQGVSMFTQGQAVKPGVHAIIGFTHAMFIMGDKNYQSLDGGNFAALDRHLAFIKNKYADNGLIHFATASELVREYLDYYSPIMTAVYGTEKETAFSSEYDIILLGKDIPADENHKHNVYVKYPLYLRDSAYYIEIFKNGRKIYTTFGLPTPFNDISFVVDDKTAKYSMKIYHNKSIFKLLSFARTFMHAIKNL